MCDGRRKETGIGAHSAALDLLMLISEAKCILIKSRIDDGCKGSQEMESIGRGEAGLRLR